MVLALACRLKPCSRSSRATVSAPTGCPALLSSAANRRVDSVVQHNGEHGSPRRVGSTSASSAASSAGSVAVSGLRPPPARRTRPSGACPVSSSATPWEILDRDAPLAWATAAIPPWPSARASPASTNRCCRSSRCGNTAANLARNDSTTSACTATTTSWPTESQTEWLFLGEPLGAAPNLAGRGDHRQRHPAPAVTASLGYAVVDTETTGLLTGYRHRIAEIAVIHLDPDGTPTGEWSTLVNPQRDLGPQAIHGIRAAEVRRAPTFDQIAADLVDLLQGR